MERQLLGKLLRDESGASAVEYAILVGGIAGVVVTIVFALGNVVSGLFQAFCTDLATQTNQTC
jgi:pilus assembly protein Flp/PilA